MAEAVALGDTVELRGVAYNGSDETISAGAGCGPGIGFVVTDSLEVDTDLYAGLAWACPLANSNELKPGETDAVDWSWLPPGVGTYRVHSYVRVTDGPRINSPRVAILVVDLSAGH